MKSRLLCIVLLSLLIGCATLATSNLSSLFGPADPSRFDDPPLTTSSAVSFERDVQPILDSRCVVCHACYDAPCQLKLSSWEGLARGASKRPVYDPERLLAGEPTRLFIDAQQPSDWRGKAFFPVLNEFASRGVADTQASLLARMLALKDRHPLQADVPVEGKLDFSLDREQQCARIEEFDDFERKNPQWGMPFGLPALSSQETSTIRRWLELGAPHAGAPDLASSTQRQIADWERFFNGDSDKEQLVSRYIYEHLFLAHLYFEGETHPHFFRLVRSTTPPGQPVQEIASRRPYEDPEVSRFFYRLRPEPESISAKSHMPYSLSAQRMGRWRDLFYSTDYKVGTLPGYSAEIASNPFRTFAALPVGARYRFMLDEAQFTIMGFIKGPVCRGQTALNVINDHFWVFFQDPDTLAESDESFLERESRNLNLPAEQDNTVLLLTPALRYAAQERKFLEAKSDYYEKRFKQAANVNLRLVWDGEGRNQNAALTIYRHFDSATVLKGLNGERPKTAWIFSYSLLERVHYLLVAGYDVFGNLSHQLNTRLYMDFLRMEGEFNFIALLPQASRIPVRDRWYEDASPDVKDYVYGKYAHFNVETGLQFSGKESADQELMSMLSQHVAPILDTTHALSKVAENPLQRDLQNLSAITGSALQWLPEASLLRIEDAGMPALTLSLLRNTARKNVTQLLAERRTLVPAENSLDVLSGIVGAYPNAFFRISRKALPAFTEQVSKLSSEADYAALLTRFGVRRSSPAFWQLSDALIADYKRSAPFEAGLLDYNRFENR